MALLDARVRALMVDALPKSRRFNELAAEATGLDHAIERGWADAADQARLTEVDAELAVIRVELEMLQRMARADANYLAFCGHVIARFTAAQEQTSASGETRFAHAFATDAIAGWSAEAKAEGNLAFSWLLLSISDLWLLEFPDQGPPELSADG